MRYLRDFHTICDRFLAVVETYEDRRLTAGRQELLGAGRMLADTVPQLRPAPDTAVGVLAQTFRGILYHHVSHTSTIAANSQTTALYASCLSTDESWVNKDLVGSIRSLVTVEPPLFGRRFPTLLSQYPRLMAAAQDLLQDLEGLSRRSRADGIGVFDNLRSYIDR
jgi:hypothetical protein